MKILLTGASGFLGSALASKLQDDGHEVALLLRPTSSLGRLEGRRFEEMRRADHGAQRDFIRSFGPQAVIHTACSYGRQGESLLDLIDANLRFGMTLLEALPESSGEPCIFINTGTALPSATSPYALSKHQFADWGRLLAQSEPGRLRFLNVELQHMFGAGDDATKFTTHVLHACHERRPELRLTAGEQRRDFIYIEDVVSAYTTLLHASESLGPAANIPVGSGDAPTVRHFVEMVHRLCASDTRLRFGAVPYRPTEAMHCQADLSLMRGLGWSPAWSMEAGLKRTIDLEFDR